MSKQTITAFYDSREHANNAGLMLQQAGIPSSDITISPESAAAEYTGTAERGSTGFWASLENMFGGYDDRDTYAEGVRRGGTMLVAHVDDAKVDEAVAILDQHGSVDLSERENTWRSEGWTSGSAITGGGVADTGVGALRSMASAREVDAVGLRSASDASYVKPAVGSAPATSAVRSGADDVLQVVEETLNVGKRAVNRGKVRLHSYVVETPVTETVNLREETVTIDRRPVDRALGAADLGVDAFRDRTIEMDEIAEEAVVGKTTRVVEEIGIRKDAADRVQTINDSVRSTKVEIEDGRSVGSATSRVTSFAGEIAKDMEVVGSDGQHVGVIDHVDGTTIKLKRMDPASGGTHHLISTDSVKSVDSKVTLMTTAADVKSRWTAA